jgi:hypothetical protein
MVLLRWCVCAVGSLPGGATGGARFGGTKPGQRRQGQGSRSRGEGRWDWQGAGWASESWAPGGLAPEGWGRGRRVGQQPPPWPVAGEGAPHYEVCGEAVAFQRFLWRAAEINPWALIWPWVRHPTGEELSRRPCSWACVRLGQPNGGPGCGSSCRDQKYLNGEKGFRKWCCGG